MSSSNSQFSQFSSFGRSHENPNDGSWENGHEQQWGQQNGQHPEVPLESQYYPNALRNMPSGNINVPQGMNLDLRSGPSDKNESLDLGTSQNGEQFMSHFPGPPIQTNKSCQQGPDGCNLFIFHIPNDLTNMDLYNLFTPFGAVISARIMVENETGRSRGFGFVSFDHPSAANAAIRSMNGFQIGHKRLKVAHKKEMPGERNNGFGDEMILMPRSPQGMVDGRGFMRSNSNPNVHLNNQSPYMTPDMRFQQPPATNHHQQNRFYSQGSDHNIEQSMASMNLNAYGHQRPPQHGGNSPYGYNQKQSQNNVGGGYQQQQQQQQMQLQQLQLQQQQQQQKAGVWKQPSHPPPERTGSNQSAISTTSNSSYDLNIGNSSVESSSPPDSRTSRSNSNSGGEPPYNHANAAHRQSESSYFGSGHGTGIDLLNSVRNGLNQSSSFEAYRSHDGGLWGAQDLALRSTHSISPPKTINSHGAIERRSSSNSPSNSSPNRGFSRSPVSVVAPGNAANGGGAGAISSNAQTAANINSNGGVLDLASSLGVGSGKLSNTSALTSALNAGINALNDDDGSNSPPSAEARLEAANAPAAAPAPVPAVAPLQLPAGNMSTEQILMLQEQLRQQQALIAGQNELLQALLAQQQAAQSNNAAADQSKNN